MPEKKLLPQFQWVFLDFDNTIWDFDSNAEEALNILFHRHSLHLHAGHSAEEFVALYKKINQAFWRNYEKGVITKDFLRTRRFTQTFLEMGIPEDEHPENAWEEYLSICPSLTRLMPGAIEFLELIGSKYPLGVITNGFYNTQHGKIKASGLEGCFRFVIDSESSGHAKPAAEIFQLALDKAGVKPEQALYIGDTWDTDIAGASAVGIPVIWYNPFMNQRGEKPVADSLFTGEFSSLSAIGEYIMAG